jgi:hypothetical protein
MLFAWLQSVCLIFQVFFEGIESRIAAGVRVEEVGYQLQFSKQELRKVMKEYSGKEVTNRNTVVLIDLLLMSLNF